MHFQDFIGQDTTQHFELTRAQDQGWRPFTGSDLLFSSTAVAQDNEIFTTRFITLSVLDVTDEPAVTFIWKQM